MTQILSRRHHHSNSDESFENLLYYKDCKHKHGEVTDLPKIKLSEMQPPTPRTPDCPFPKMCCSMSCGNECVNNQMPFTSRQMQPLQDMQQSMQPPQPRQMQLSPPILRRKKLQQPGSLMSPMALSDLQMPINSRRDFGFTKEKIKSLISQDNDIRKILKDLVRVTMQKVEVMDMVKDKTETTTPSKNEDEDDYDDELE